MRGRAIQGSAPFTKLKHYNEKSFGRGRYFKILVRGARKLTGENLKLVWAKFSTIS
jgi:hypothetical protein